MPTLEISSRTNPWFKRFRAALDQHDEEIVIEGPKQVADAIAAAWEPIAVAAPEGTFPREVMRLQFTSALLGALAGTVNHQGTIALFRRPRTTIRDVFHNRSTVVVTLDGVQDPGNVGTIIRLAAAFGAGGVIITGGGADPFGPKSIRASAGAILTVPVVTAPRRAILDEAAASGFPLFAAAGGSGRLHVPLASAVIVFGSEGRGISAEFEKEAERISIPMSPGVESLNVAMAAAIVLHRSYELRAGHAQ